jgi:SAM-dependent methyltransferase
MAGINYLEWTENLVTEFWNGAEKLGIETISFGHLAKRSVHWIIARHLTPGGRHLDYGAGNGELAAYLIDKGFPFAIDDPAGDRIAAAQKFLSPGKTFLPFDPRKSGQFDIVTCFEVIEHVLDHLLDDFIATLARHVKPGGKLILTCPNKENLNNGMVYCPISKLAFHRWQHMRSIDLEWVHTKFEPYGFSKILGYQLDFNDELYEPFLGHMGFGPKPARNEIMPLHIYQLINNVDGFAGGGSCLLYIAQKDHA